MPVAATANSLWRVGIKGRLEEQQVLNVLDFACPVGSANVELDLIVALFQCWVLHLLPVISQNYTLEQITYKQISPVLSNEYIYTPTADNVGEASGDCEPSFVAALLSKQTALGGRTHHGRMYIAGVPEGSKIGSLISTEDPFWNGLLGFVTCIASKFITGDPPVSRTFVLGVFSRKLGGETFPANVAGFTPITALVPHRELATMRSRKIGRGN